VDIVEEILKEGLGTGQRQWKMIVMAENLLKSIKCHQKINIKIKT